MLYEVSMEKLSQPLLDWYQENARALPWRSRPSFYHVWISEIMCQQTRIEAVLPYYRRFLEALPDVKSLAECPEDRLLKLWEGLGYYNRVRNMQKAAQTIMAEYGGQFPETCDEIRQLFSACRRPHGPMRIIAWRGFCIDTRLRY